MRVIARISIVFLCVLFLTPLVFAADKTSADLVNEANQAIKSVTVAEAKQMIDKGVMVIDVREQNEYDAEHIPGAVLIPRGFLEFQIAAKIPDKNTTFIIHCRSGGRSALATQSVLAMGYKNALNMKGGFLAWQAAALPTEKSK
jgi:sulfur dioxygenase